MVGLFHIRRIYHIMEDWVKAKYKLFCVIKIKFYICINVRSDESLGTWDNTTGKSLNFHFNENKLKFCVVEH